MENVNIISDPVLLLLVDIYSIVLFGAIFNCCNNFALYLVTRVNTGTYSFVSVISNVVAYAVVEIMQVND